MYDTDYTKDDTGYPGDTEAFLDNFSLQETKLLVLTSGTKPVVQSQNQGGLGDSSLGTDKCTVARNLHFAFMRYIHMSIRVMHINLPNKC